MPAESQRLRRRITRRDRWFLALLVCAALVATPVAVLLADHQSSPSTRRCVTTTRAGIMGAGTYKYCGTDAIPFCRTFAPGDDDLTAQCQKYGFLRR